MNEEPNGSSEISILVADRPDHWQLRLEICHRVRPPKAETRPHASTQCGPARSRRTSGDGGASTLPREFEHSGGIAIPAKGGAKPIELWIWAMPLSPSARCLLSRWCFCQAPSNPCNPRTVSPARFEIRACVLKRLGSSRVSGILHPHLVPGVEKHSPRRALFSGS